MDIDIFNYKKKYSDDRCPNPIHFNTPLLIIYLSSIETLICHRDIEFDRLHFLQFCTNYDTLFSKYRIELIVALSSTNATKTNADVKMHFEYKSHAILQYVKDNNMLLCCLQLRISQGDQNEIQNQAM